MFVCFGGCVCDRDGENLVIFLSFPVKLPNSLSPSTLHGRSRWWDGTGPRVHTHTHAYEHNRTKSAITGQSGNGEAVSATAIDRTEHSRKKKGIRKDRKSVCRFVCVSKSGKWRAGQSHKNSRYSMQNIQRAGVNNWRHILSIFLNLFHVLWQIGAARGSRVERSLHQAEAGRSVGSWGSS